MDQFELSCFHIFDVQAWGSYFAQLFNLHYGHCKWCTLIFKQIYINTFCKNLLFGFVKKNGLLFLNYGKSWRACNICNNTIHLLIWGSDFSIKKTKHFYLQLCMPILSVKKAELGMFFLLLNHKHHYAPIFWLCTMIRWCEKLQTVSKRCIFVKSCDKWQKWRKP